MPVELHATSPDQCLLASRPLRGLQRKWTDEGAEEDGPFQVRQGREGVAAASSA
jgi:hypothetical protein